MNFGYEPGNLIFKDVNVSVEQGKLVAVVGQNGCGKSTLLKLLGHVIFPSDDQGELFIPTHLRILHVSRDPMFISLSIWQNLTFGSSHPVDISIDRVKRILNRFHMKKTL